MYRTIFHPVTRFESDRALAIIGGAIVALLVLLAVTTVLSDGSTAGSPSNPWNERVRIIATDSTAGGGVVETVCVGYPAGADRVRTSSSCFDDPIRIGDRVRVEPVGAQSDLDPSPAATVGSIERGELFIALTDEGADR